MKFFKPTFRKTAVGTSKTPAVAQAAETEAAPRAQSVELDVGPAHGDARDGQEAQPVGGEQQPQEPSASATPQPATPASVCEPEALAASMPTFLCPTPKSVNVDLDEGASADTEQSDHEDDDAKDGGCGLFQRKKPTVKSVCKRTSSRNSLKNMTMRDLIYWYPKDQPPPKWRQQDSPEQQPAEEAAGDRKREGGDSVDSGQPPAKMARVEQQPAKHAPQVMLDSHGNIVLNEESLVIREECNEQLVDVREDTGELKATYQSFRSNCVRRGKQWSHKETVRFYKALSTIGTDFSFMRSLFVNKEGKFLRSREELKRKYKREEKANPHLIDRVLQVRKAYDLSMFQPGSESEGENPAPETRERQLSTSDLPSDRTNPVCPALSYVQTRSEAVHT